MEKKLELKNDENKIKTILEYYVLTNKLKNVIRSGWLAWGVDAKRVESIAEHIYGTCMLALAIWSETLPSVNISEVITMIALHETEEIAIGDITPFDDEQKQQKKHNGQMEVQKIFKDLVAKDAYFKLIQDFDARKTPEAIFAHKCDKLECDIQARLYSDMGNLKYENAGKIKNNQFILEQRKNGELDVANYFAVNDERHFTQDDIFLKINQYIQKNHILKENNEANVK